MEEKQIELRGRLFKCFQDGRCFVFKDKNSRGNLQTPYWFQLNAVNKDGYSIFHSHSNGSFKVHRVIAAAFLGLQFEDKTQIIDHLDGNRSNNNIKNLRVCTQYQNCQNYIKKDIKGLTQRENGTWRAYINVNKQRLSKTLKTKDEAIQWRLDKEKEYGYIHSTIYSNKV